MSEQSNDPHGLSAILESVEAGALDGATSEQRKQVVRKLVAVAQEQSGKIRELEARAKAAERTSADAERKAERANAVAQSGDEAVQSALNKVGRNRPCPCGAGRNAKHFN